MTWYLYWLESRARLKAALAGPVVIGGVFAYLYRSMIPIPMQSGHLANGLRGLDGLAASIGTANLAVLSAHTAILPAVVFLVAFVFSGNGLRLRGMASAYQTLALPASRARLMTVRLLFALVPAALGLAVTMAVHGAIAAAYGASVPWVWMAETSGLGFAAAAAIAGVIGLLRIYMDRIFAALIAMSAVTLWLHWWGENQQRLFLLAWADFPWEFLGAAMAVAVVSLALTFWCGARKEF